MQQPPPMALAGVRRLLVSSLLLRSQSAPVWAAHPRLLTSLRTFRTPTSSSVVVKGQRQGRGGRVAAAAAAAATTEAPAARTFADLGISPALQSAMAEYQLVEPTEIQVSRRQNVRCPGKHAHVQCS